MQSLGNIVQTLQFCFRGMEVCWERHERNSHFRFCCWELHRGSHSWSRLAWGAVQWLHCTRTLRAPSLGSNVLRRSTMMKLMFPRASSARLNQ